jgi:hypothetical protein
MTLKLSQSDAFAAPGFHLASGIIYFDRGIRDKQGCCNQAAITSAGLVPVT